MVNGLATQSRRPNCSKGTPMELGNNIGDNLPSLQRVMEPPSAFGEQEISEKTIWSFWHSGFANLTPLLRLFSVNYFCRFRQLFLPVHPLFLTALLGHSGAVAGHVEFQDDRVVDHPLGPPPYPASSPALALGNPIQSRPGPVASHSTPGLKACLQLTQRPRKLAPPRSAGVPCCGFSRHPAHRSSRRRP